jgi:hypothetical protein
MPTEDTIEAIIKTILSNPPSNESTTCLWVVNPLLLASGYSVFDIYSQHADSNGQFPDYTILPNTPYTWFLEAKSWNVTLQDSHAQQSLNYANTNGRPWVVLTNGKVWRLYDNTIQGLATDKFVVETHLDIPNQIKEFLNAISKLSVTTGQLERYAVQSKIASALESSLFDPDSMIIKSIYNVLRTQPGMARVSTDDVVQFFTKSTAPLEEDLLDVTPKRNIRKPSSGKGEKTFTELASDIEQAVTGKKPEALILPDDTRLDVVNWRDLAFEVILWLSKNNKMPEIPYRSGNFGHRYLLNYSPHHQKGNMREHKAFDYRGRSIYLDTKRSASDLVISIARLCKNVGVSTDAIKVVAREE